MGHSNDYTRLRGAADPELSPGSLVGEFQIEGLLGEGGMGHVYAAIHPLIAKRAAIKVLRPELSRDPQMLERFVLEARAVNEIQHPNIVDIFAFGTLDDGRHYFVMEWLRGTSLGDRLQEGRLELGKACEILTAIMNALAASHAIGIVHRDLKPDNVFLAEIKDSPSHIVKLLDFGIAKLVQGGDDRIDQTGTGVFIGTLMYASPEQLRGERVDHRTDLYALGVMAFEMLAGRMPFEGTTGPEIIAKHLLEPAPSVAQFLPSLPRKLAVLVDGMLAKDPAQRPSLDEVRDAFRDVAVSPRIEAPPRRHVRLVLTTALAASVVMVGIGTFIATRSTPGIPTSQDAPSSATSEKIEPAPQPANASAQPPDASTEPSAGLDSSVGVVTPSVADTKPVAAAGDVGSDKTATKRPAATKQRARKRDKQPKKQTKDPVDQDGLL